MARARGKKHVLFYKRRNCAQAMLGVILNCRPLDSFIMSQLALNMTTSPTNKIKIHVVINFFSKIKQTKDHLLFGGLFVGHSVCRTGQVY
jgi:hypothetical protein